MYKTGVNGQLFQDNSAVTSNENHSYLLHPCHLVFNSWYVSLDRIYNFFKRSDICNVLGFLCCLYSLVYRKECEMLRSELTDQHSEDKKSALKQLNLMKDQEMEAARTGWESKIQELHQQVIQIIDDVMIRVR